MALSCPSSVYQGSNAVRTQSTNKPDIMPKANGQNLQGSSMLSACWILPAMWSMGRLGRGNRNSCLLGADEADGSLYLAWWQGKPHACCGMHSLWSRFSWVVTVPFGYG